MRIIKYPSYFRISDTFNEIGICWKFGQNLWLWRSDGALNLQIKAPRSKPPAFISWLKKRIKLKCRRMPPCAVAPAKSDPRCCFNVLTQTLEGSFSSSRYFALSAGLQSMGRNQQAGWRAETYLCRIIPPSASFSRHILAKLILSSVRLLHSVMALVYVPIRVFFLTKCVIFKIFADSDTCRQICVTAAAANLWLRNRVMRSRDGC